jgi:large subunit ribosomal protein L5
MLSLKEEYQKNIIPKLLEKFKYSNKLEVPKMVKVVVNVGIGKFRQDEKMIETVKNTLTSITGQKPAFRVSNKAISGFKLRAGDKVGLMVTLRNNMMYDFVSKLTRIALPRVRDFRGLKESALDKQNNLNIGFKEFSVFPEIKLEKIDKIHSLQVNISTSAQNRDEAKELFLLLGFIFQK